MIICDKLGWKCRTRKNLLCVYFACKFFICPTCINKKFCVYFTYVLHESTRILYVSIFHMSYMNLREFCVCLIACIFFVCPTRIYKNFDVSILLVNFLYVLHESTRIVYVSILHVHFLYVIQVSTRSCICLFFTSYVLHESTRVLYVSILYTHFQYALHVSTRSCLCLFRMSYMNLQKSYMCQFYLCIFCMSYMYPQEVVCVYFV